MWGSSLRRLPQPGRWTRPFVEAGDPETKGAPAHAAVAQGDFIGRSHQEEVDGVKAAVGLAVRATIQRLLQLLKAAGVGVWKCSRTAIRQYERIQTGVPAFCADFGNLFWQRV